MVRGGGSSASAVTLKGWRSRFGAIQAEQAELDDQREACQKAMKLSGMGDAKGFDMAEIGNDKKPASLHISEADYRGMFDAVQKRMPSYRIEAKSFDATTKAPFGTGDFTSGGLPSVLMPQLTTELPLSTAQATLLRFNRRDLRPPCRCPVYQRSLPVLPWTASPSAQAPFCP